MTQPPTAARDSQGSVWPLRDTWNRGTESLYSAWIEKLFDAPLEAEPSWPALHEVLRDKSRNFLFNHLGLREDEKAIIYRPDCADLPYFFARVFRVQDRATVRVLEVHARRWRRQPAEVPAVVEHSERGAPLPPRPNKIPRQPACSGSLTSQSRLERSDFRRGRKDLCRASDIIWGGPSLMAFSPETGERRRTTTTPIIIPSG